MIDTFREIETDESHLWGWKLMYSALFEPAEQDWCDVIVINLSLYLTKTGILCGCCEDGHAVEGVRRR